MGIGKGKLIVGNWKMNSSPAADSALLECFAKSSASFGTATVVVCPPFTAIAAASKILAGSPISIGAQNVHWEASGPFTGEISPSMLRDVGVDYVIVGHSERRSAFGENDAILSKKFYAAMASGITPILCLGESQSERENGLQSAVVERQLRAVIDPQKIEHFGNFAVAYEPVWAIGTGKSATAEEAQTMHRHLRSVLADIFGEKFAEDIRLLYGGSVSGSNAAELFAQKDIDGALVGGASRKADEFLAIVASGT
ncbi:MAG: triose-phosphate isomerase [Puniceicoccales bacterium]|jgi:triosephosphate isomerase|nr:triose-phosphate isomerase [Puniceicoccales bacterium]